MCIQSEDSFTLCLSKRNVFIGILEVEMPFDGDGILEDLQQPQFKLPRLNSRRKCNDNHLNLLVEAGLSSTILFDCI